MNRVTRIAFGAAIAAFAALPAATASAAGAFPTVLFENTTGAADTIFTGAPDHVALGIGGQIVTLDFGVSLVANLAGVDFTVYEVDNGAPEFERIAVSVSLDGLTFTDVTASETSYVAIVGDALHGNATCARSYDLGAMTLARYIRIDGDGTGAAAGIADFDLDAVGAINFAPVPAPAAPPLMLGAMAAFVGLRRRSRG